MNVYAEDGALVHEGERLCSIRNPFDRTFTDCEIPFTWVLVGLLENPIVYPGTPLCHIVEVTGSALKVLETESSE